MKKLYAPIVAGMLSLPLMFGGCEERSNLQGTVLSEKYVPEVGGRGGSASKYIITIDSEYGKKIIESKKFYSDDVSNEALDVLIDVGSKVEIIGLRDSEIEKRVINVNSRAFKL